MSEKQAYLKKLEAQLKEWRAKIDAFEAKAQKAKADTRIEYNKKIKDLKTKMSVAMGKLNELKNSSEAAWEEVKRGVETAWKDLKDAFSDASSKFK